MSKRRTSDADRLAVVLRTEFGGKALPPLTGDPWFLSPPLKVIGCVLSLNRRYEAFVVPRLKAFSKKHPEMNTITELRELIDQFDSPLSFSIAELNYNHATRSSTLSGVVDFTLEVQEEHDGQTEAERLANWAAWARPGDYLAVDVIGFKLAGFQYLRMLFGAQTTKPDVRVIRFVSESIGKQVTAVQALYLLERAAKTAGLPIRELDVAIWNLPERSS